MSGVDGAVDGAVSDGCGGLDGEVADAWVCVFVYGVVVCVVCGDGVEGVRCVW